MKERFEPGKTLEERHPSDPFSVLKGASIRLAWRFARLGWKAAAQSPRGVEHQETRAAREDSPLASFDERKPLHWQMTTCDVSGWGGPLARNDGVAEESSDNRLVSMYLWTDRRSRQI